MVSRFSLCFVSESTWRILVELLLEIIRAAMSMTVFADAWGPEHGGCLLYILLYGYSVCKTFTFL